jgi:stage V sporulation protein S
MNVLKVSTTTDPTATAGAIANGFLIDGAAEIPVMGPRAVNQVVKAIARSYLAASGMDTYCIPSFAAVRIAGDEAEEERTGIHFRVCPRHDVRMSTARTVAG